MMNILNKTVTTACAALLTWALIPLAFGQENVTPNGIADNRERAYAFTGANIYQADGSIMDSGTLLIRAGRIVEVNENNSVPDGFFEIDLSGLYIYPGLIDIYTDYGIPELEREDNNGALKTFSQVTGHSTSMTQYVLTFAPAQYLHMMKRNAQNIGS